MAAVDAASDKTCAVLVPLNSVLRLADRFRGLSKLAWPIEGWRYFTYSWVLPRKDVVEI